MFGAVAVVIDVVPDPAEPLAGAVVESCALALGAGRCRLAEQATGSARWHAIVRWKGEMLEVARVELRLDASDGAVVQSRELVLSGDDEPKDRWASVGVLIAALVASQQRTVASPEAVVESPPLERPDRAQERPQSSRVQPVEWRLDVGALAARSLDRGTPQVGGSARASVELGRLPLFFMASAAYSARPSMEPQVSWFSGALGFGVRLGPRTARWTAELRTDAVLEEWTIAAADSGDTERDRVTRFGPRIGLDLVYALEPHFRLLLGAQAGLLRPEVTVEVDGETVDQVHPFSGALFAGVRFTL